MANPQVEHGFIRIADELFEALCRTRLGGEPRQMFDAIVRQTYGYGKKDAEISAEDFTKLTGLCRQRQYEARQILIEMNMIGVTQKGNKMHLVYAIQKDYEQWQPSRKTVTVCKTKSKKCNGKPLRSVTENRYTAPPDGLTGKAKRGVINNKHSYKQKTSPNSKEVRTSPSPKGKKFYKDSRPYEIANYFLTKRCEVFPNIPKPSLQTWVQDIDYMLRLDRRKPDEVKALIDWIYTGDDRNAQFWRKNILSPGALRKKKDGVQTFDRLVIQMSESRPSKKEDDNDGFI